MVYLAARLFLSAIFLSSRASYLLAGKCCPKQSSHCTGCDMCVGSDLRSCWDDYTSKKNAAEKITDTKERLSKLCTAYAGIAKCWKHGDCCTEYAPTLAAATNLCNLDTYPLAHLDTAVVNKAQEDAKAVYDQIWHNDSGLDVPKLSVYTKAYSGHYTESPHTEYTSSKTSPDYEPTSIYAKKTKVVTSKSHDEKVYHHQHDNSNSGGSGLTLDDNSNQYVHSLKSKVEDPSNAESQGKDLKNEGKTLKLESKDTQGAAQSYSSITESKNTNKIHHRAQCSSHQHKCQSAIASQYHEARQQNKSLVKRGAFPPFPRQLNKAELHKRNVQYDAKGQPLCGIDFLGVAYPKAIAPSVARAWAA